MLDDARMYARFAAGLRGYLRQPLTPEEAARVVRDRLARRDDAFLDIVERGVYGYPASPYLPLLRQAGCEMGDLRAMVVQNGLEPALKQLSDEGVYVTFEEFKGRTPIERGGHAARHSDDAFSNPLARPTHRVRTGGSTGPSKRVATDLEHLAAQAPAILLSRQAHETLGAPMAIWREPFPAPTGVGTILRAAKCGSVPERWFSPLTADELPTEPKYRLANRLFVLLSRAFGTPVPAPEPLALDEAATIARWARKAADAAGTSVVASTVSLCVRVALAARENGIPLDGVAFAGGSETPTPAKVETIRSSGARWIPGYYSVETGAIGLGCARPVDGNDLHLMSDSLALIQRRRPVSHWRSGTTDGSGRSAEVDAFCFTSLLPSAAKILLNVESDDFGTVESRRCGCLLGELGYTTHLREVQSFGKLTGEGVTLVASQIEHLLGAVLPGRFGGSALDYQLLEEEDGDSLGRLSLVVDPAVTIEDEAALVETVLSEISAGSTAGELAQALWRKAGTLRVRRESPRWSPRGKLPPLHSTRRSCS